MYETRAIDIKATKQIIINEGGAAPCIRGTECMGIEADHISICKFASITALGFEVVAEALHRYAHDAPKVIEQRWREEELTRQLKKARKLNKLLIKVCYPISIMLE